MAMIAGVMSLSVMTGCRTGSFASEYGKSDMAYISVVSSGDYAGKSVDVVVDNETGFKVEVVRYKQSSEKHNGRLHGIMTPPHSQGYISVQSFRYDKDIFVSSQHTKLIML